MLTGLEELSLLDESDEGRLLKIFVEFPGGKKNGWKNKSYLRTRG